MRARLRECAWDALPPLLCITAVLGTVAFVCYVVGEDADVRMMRDLAERGVVRRDRVGYIPRPGPVGVSDDS